MELLPGRHELALHVFDRHDLQWWIDTIGQRYEQDALPQHGLFRRGLLIVVIGFASTVALAKFLLRGEIIE